MKSKVRFFGAGMAHHNYRLELNVRCSRDSEPVFFTPKMFGPSHEFAVEMAKASPGAEFRIYP